MTNNTTLFDTSDLKVGDMWPQRWLHSHGPIVEITDYPGDQEFARNYGITGLATFADGTSVSLAGVIPAESDLVAKLQFNR